MSSLAIPKVEHGTRVPSPTLVKDKLLEHPPRGSEIPSFLEIFSLKKRRIDFITIKSNDNKVYQSIDSVRRLLSKHYRSYFVVQSPTSGRHYHAMAQRDGARSLKVRRGVHLKVSVIGSNRTKNQLRQVEFPDNPIEELAYQKKVDACCVRTPSYKLHVGKCYMYLIQNLYENYLFKKYECFAVKIDR